MNGTEVLRQHDPGFLRARRREKILLFGVAGLAILAVIFAVGAVVGTIHNETRITRLQPRVTRIEKTPCAQNPSGRACQRLRAEVERQANQRVTCIPLEKAGYPCPRHGAEFQTTGGKASSTTGGAGGGDAQQQPSSKGHQEPGPHKGGTHPSPGQAPSAKPSPSEGNAAASPSPGTPNGKPPAQAAGEAATKAAGVAFGVVEEAAEAVTDTVCPLVKSC